MPTIDDPRRARPCVRLRPRRRLCRGFARQGPARQGSIRQDPGRQAAGRRRQGGFTLVELMVVIVIIGLLATIVAINVLPSGDKARVTRARADIATIESALELYRLQNGGYPTSAQGLVALVQAPAGANAASYQPGGYIKGGRVPTDPWGHAYLYAMPGTHGEADVWTLGADNKQGGSGVDADLGNWPDK